MLQEPEQRLAGAAELGDLGEDQHDGLLHAPIRILLQTVASLHEADRSRDDQLAPACLRVTRRQRALAQQIEFVFVETALQSEQQPIIALSGCVDRFLIDQHRVDHAAHLDQLLPVAAVACEARHFPRRHRADLAETDFGHHAFKTNPRDTASRRAAHIIVDGLDLGPAEGHQPIPHRILQRAALAIVQHLMGGRLTNIEHRLAFEMVRQDLVSHRGVLPSLVRDRNGAAHGRREVAPSGSSPSRASPPATGASEAPGPSGGTDPTDWLRADDLRDGGVGVALASLRFSGQDSPLAPETGGFDDWGACTSASSVFSSSSAARSTCGKSSIRTGKQAAESNIHAGSSSQRPVIPPSRLQRKYPVSPLSNASWTWTVSPYQGCHG